MTYKTPSSSARRAPRAQLKESPTAVLKLQDGRLITGKLLVISEVGGLLSLPGCLAPHAQVKLMFVTGAGTVLGTAEMLDTRGPLVQPFQFASISGPDQKRIQVFVGVNSQRSSDEEDEWIQKYRAAVDRNDQPKPYTVRWTFRGLTFGLFSMAAVTHWFRTYGLH